MRMPTAISEALSNNNLNDIIKPMRNTISKCITVFAIGLLAPQIMQAQGTLFVSSLSTNSTGSASVGSDSWLAAEFGSGNNIGGYVLNSIQLGMVNASGNPSAFTVMIYAVGNFPGADNPGTSLGTLSGAADPATTGLYTYTASSGLSLSPSTIYFIVVTAGTTVANGAYNWSESTYPPSVNNWGVGNGIIRSSNGTSGWSPTPYLGIAQFAIYATLVPEPDIIGLFALGGLLVGFWRWKAREF